MTLADLSFPIAVVLIPLGLFAAFYVIWALFGLRNVFAFGVPSLRLYAVSAVFAAGSVLLFGALLVVMSRYDLTAVVSLAGAVKLFTAPPAGL